MSTLTLPGTGPTIATAHDATDLVGDALGAGADTVVIPVERLSPEFFRLASGLAGELLQKCTNYRLKVVVVGDIAAYTARSKPLRDFVYESNRRGDVRFVADAAEL